MKILKSLLNLIKRSQLQRRFAGCCWTFYCLWRFIGWWWRFVLDRAGSETRRLSCLKRKWVAFVWTDLKSSDSSIGSLNDRELKEDRTTDDFLGGFPCVVVVRDGSDGGGAYEISRVSEQLRVLNLAKSFAARSQRTALSGWRFGSIWMKCCGIIGCPWRNLSVCRQWNQT